MSMNIELDDLVNQVMASLSEAPNDEPQADKSLRPRFYELIVLVLGNLFSQMPATGNIYDRTTLNRVVLGLDDANAATLGKRADDWLRLEGIIKQEEGKRAYFLPLDTQAALSLSTPSGLLGDVCGSVLKRYMQANPSDNLRNSTRALGAVLLVILSKP